MFCFEHYEGIFLFFFLEYENKVKNVDFEAFVGKRELNKQSNRLML